MKDRAARWLPVAAGVAAATMTGLAVRAFLVEPASVEVTRHDLPVRGLPADWRGACVVHLTDLHYGDPRSDRLLSWMVRTVNDLRPDLVLVTGDYVLRSLGEVEPCARYLGELRSRHGIVGVLGDHDFFRRTGRTIPGLPERLEGAGVRLLRNAGIELPGGLRVAGVDPGTHLIQRDDLGAALKATAGGLPHILLAHSPDVLPQAAERGIPVVLSGHTHGGQVVVPLYGPPVTHLRLPREYASGWSGMAETRMYTGRGLASHYSLRFLCRPEIAVFTLRDG